MKLAAVSLVYNEENLVRGCIRSFKPFVDKHVMVVGTEPYYGPKEPMDRSFEIAAEEGAVVIAGKYKLDHHQRNAGLDLLADLGEFDWVLISDVDMWFEHRTVFHMIASLAGMHEDAAIMSQYSYWKDTDHRLVNDTFKPVVAVRPHVRFSHIGNVNCPYDVMGDDLKLHHLAWCAPKDIYKKVVTYPHAPEFDGAAWHRLYYENWKGGDTAVLPTGRFKVEFNPLPTELKAYLEAA